MSALRYRGRHHRLGLVRHLFRVLTRRARSRGPRDDRPAMPPPDMAASGGGDRGAFTAEFAVALPALTLMLTLGLGVVSAAAAHGRCYDAARDAALAAARGEPGVTAGTASAPEGSTVTLRVEGDRVRAVVTVPIRTLGLRLPDLTVTGEAVAAVEPGVAAVAE